MNRPMKIRKKMEKLFVPHRVQKEIYIRPDYNGNEKIYIFKSCHSKSFTNKFTERIKERHMFSIILFPPTYTKYHFTYIL